jgi:superfamily II DNA/RNA helicase
VDIAESWGRGRRVDDTDEDYLDEEDDEESEDDEEDFSRLPSPKKSSPAVSDVQMMLFSATMPGWICKLTDKHMVNPVFLDAVQEGETRLAATIKHLAVRLPNLSNRIDALTSYVEDLIITQGAGGQTIVFTNTKEEADNLVS